MSAGGIGGGSGAAIGSPVSGATANRVLFGDASGNLADDPDLAYTQSSNLFLRTHTHNDATPSTAAIETALINSGANVLWLHLLGSGSIRRAAIGWTVIGGDDFFNAWGANGFRFLAGSTEKMRGSSLGVALFPQIAYIGGTLESFFADAAHDGTGTDVFYTYAAGSSKLATNGDRIEFEYVLTFAANANNKTVIVAFGATELYNSGAVAKNGGSLTVRGTVWRTGSATQRFLVRVMDDASTTRFPVVAGYGTAAETLSGSVALELRGTATAASDIVARAGWVKFQENA